MRVPKSDTLEAHLVAACRKREGPTCRGHSKARPCACQLIYLRRLSHDARLTLLFPVLLPDQPVAASDGTDIVVVGCFRFKIAAEIKVMISPTGKGSMKAIAAFLKGLSIMAFRAFIS